MRQALLLVAEINRKKIAIKKTKNSKLKMDYCKAIVRDKQQLREYCQFKKLDYNEIARWIIAYR